MRRKLIPLLILATLLMPTATAFAQESVGNAGSVTALTLVACVVGFIGFILLIVILVTLGLLGHVLSNDGDE